MADITVPTTGTVENPFQDSPPVAPAAPSSPIGAYLNSTAQAVQGNLSLAFGANPDLEAELARVSKQTGVPIESVRKFPDQVKQQAALSDMDFQKIARQFPTTAAYFQSLDNAKVAHDDVPNLMGVEHATYQFTAPTQWLTSPQSTLTGPAGQMAGDVPQQAQLLNAAADMPQLRPDNSPLPFRTRLTDWARGLLGLGPSEGNAQGAGAAQAFIQTFSKQTGMSAGDMRQAVGGVSEIPTQFAQGFENSSLAGLAPDVNGPAQTTAGQVASGVGNLAGFMLGAPLKLAEGAVERVGGSLLEHTAGESFAKALTKDVARQATTLGLASSITATGQALDANSPSAALAQLGNAGVSGAENGAVFGLMGRLLPDNTFVQTAARAIGTNALMDTLQGTTPWDNRSLADKVFDYGLNTLFSMHGAGRATGGWLTDAAKTSTAANDAANLGQLAQAAAGSKLRARDPEAFKAFVEQASDGAPIQNVYVDGNTLANALAQSGVKLDDVQATMPRVAQQLRGAVEFGTDVSIPVSDFATHIAGGPLQDALMPHLKTDPEGMTAEQANQFMQSSVESFQQAAQNFAADKANDDAVATSAQAVHDDILNQLNTANRFTPDVNKAYAAMMREFYTNTGARLGLSPEAMYERYPLRIAAEDVTGANVFNQEPKPPVAALQGDEIAPPNADIKSLRAAAGDFYAQKLAGTTVHNPALGDVEFTKRGMKKMLATSANPDKLKLVAALPDLLSNGELVRSQDNKYPDTHKNIVRYHWLRGEVTLDGKPVTVEVNVEEHRDGKLYYNHVLPGNEYFQGEGGQVQRPSRPGVAPSADRESTNGEHPSEDIGAGPSNQSLTHAPDNLNLHLVGQDARGKLSFANDITSAPSTITLLRDADLSTFTHESGHFYLEALNHIAQSPDAPPEMKGDMQTVLDWLGVKSPEEWQKMSIDEKRQQHEQFARGFEAYLFEGKAPSEALRGVFQRMRSWMVAVYRSLRNLNVSLSPEVRGVFDRLLASNDAIRDAEAQRAYAPMFRTAEEAGMSPDQFADYHKLGQEATLTASDELTARTLRDMRYMETSKSRALREVQKDVAAKRRAVREEVAAQVSAEPVYQAQEYLLKESRKPQPEAADMIAERFGFNDAAEMTAAIANAEPKKQVIEAVTDHRMLERYGDITTPQAMNAAANEAIHNEVRTRFIATELKALAKATGPVRVLEKAAKEVAESTIARSRIRDINPGKYGAAEARAAKYADESRAAGAALDVIAQQKRNQLLNNQLEKVARNAQTEVTKSVDYLKKFGKPGVRDGLSGDYLAQIDALLDRFDLRTSVSGSALDKRASLLDWVRQQQDAGYDPAIPDALLNEAMRAHYKDMSLEAFRGLVDSVKSIEHLGRMKQKLLDAQDLREFTAVVDEAVAQAAKLPQRAPDAVRNPGQGGRGLDRVDAAFLRAKSALRNMDASLLKMEQVIDWLDEHNPNGVFNRVVFRRIADAGHFENDLRTEMSAKLRDIADSTPGEVKRDFSTRYAVPELIDSRTNKPSQMLKSEIIAMALNTGNDSNYQKLLAGEKWDDANVQAVLARHMSKGDWDFVQKTWDAIESLWPHIEKLEKDMSGVAPPKVQPREVVTPHGTYRGGYYPVVYDPLRNFNAEKNRQKGDNLFDNNYQRATTAKGHTIERNENYSAPLYLSLDVLPRHLAQVIHDVAYRQPVMDADRFLADGRVRGAIEGTLGREVYQQFRPWLQSIANDKAFDQRAVAFWEQFAHKVRTNATMVGLGFRLSTMLVHGATALSNSVGEVGPRWMASGMKSFLSEGAMTGARDFIFERSGEMRNRMNEIDRDVRDALREMDLHSQGAAVSSAAKGLDAVKRFAYFGVAQLDMLSALPTWMGAYNKSLHEGMSEQDAIYAADKAVRNAHGAGGVKDLAAVQRSKSEFFKLTTMFYSFWNHFYNRQRDIARTAASIPGSIQDGNYQKAAGDFGMVLARSLFYFAVPQLLHALINPHKGQGDDSEPLALWAAKDIGLGLFSGIPIVRDLATSAMTGSDYKLSPVVQMASSLAKTGKDISAVAHGQAVPQQWVKHAVTNAGYVFGLPTGQVASTTQFLWDVSNGRQSPQDVADWYHGLVFGHAQH
jgi:hypothetical protein